MTDMTWASMRKHMAPLDGREPPVKEKTNKRKFTMSFTDKLTKTIYLSEKDNNVHVAVKEDDLLYLAQRNFTEAFLTVLHDFRAAGRKVSYDELLWPFVYRNDEATLCKVLSYAPSSTLAALFVKCHFTDRPEDPRSLLEKEINDREARDGSRVGLSQRDADAFLSQAAQLSDFPTMSLVVGLCAKGKVFSDSTIRHLGYYLMRNKKASVVDVLSFLNVPQQIRLLKLNLVSRVDEEFIGNLLEQVAEEQKDLTVDVVLMLIDQCSPSRSADYVKQLYDDLGTNWSKYVPLKAMAMLLYEARGKDDVSGWLLETEPRAARIEFVESVSVLYDLLRNDVGGLAFDVIILQSLADSGELLDMIKDTHKKHIKDPPMFHTRETKHTAILTFILERFPDLLMDLRNSAGQPLLHYSAAAGDFASLSAMAPFLTSTMLSMLNPESKTPYMLLEEKRRREDRTEAWTELMLLYRPRSSRAKRA